MRSVIDFYRRNPLVLVLVLVVGGALCAAVAATAADGGFIAPVVFAVLVGLLIGLGVAWYRNGVDG
jgi:multisubunit Na+/H+ antiporter MnhB subunit